MQGQQNSEATATIPDHRGEREYSTGLMTFTGLIASTVGSVAVTGTGDETVLDTGRTIVRSGYIDGGNADFSLGAVVFVGAGIA